MNGADNCNFQQIPKGLQCLDDEEDVEHHGGGEWWFIRCSTLGNALTWERRTTLNDVHRNTEGQEN